MPDSPIIKLLKEHQRKWLKPAAEGVCPQTAKAVYNNHNNNQNAQEQKREAREEHEEVGVR